MNFAQLREALIAALTANDIPTAFGHWQAMRTVADRPRGTYVTFVAWMREHVSDPNIGAT